MIAKAFLQFITKYSAMIPKATFALGEVHTYCRIFSWYNFAVYCKIICNDFWRCLLTLYRKRFSNGLWRQFCGSLWNIPGCFPMITLQFIATYFAMISKDSFLWFVAKYFEKIFKYNFAVYHKIIRYDLRHHLYTLLRKILRWSLKIGLWVIVIYKDSFTVHRNISCDDLRG